MKAIGIVCELNPMHRGHIHLAKSVKDLGYACVGVMSGPFVQRGQPAIMDKWDRARIAVQNSFDLIIELPQVYALQSAEYFALGAIYTLSLLNDIEALAFGSEKTWDYNRLIQVEDQVKKTLEKGEKSGSLSLNQKVNQVLNTDLPANAKLGLEYIRAIQKLDLNWDIHVLPRIGADHKSTYLNTDFPSSTALRKNLQKTSFHKLQAYLAPGTKEEDFPNKIPSLNQVKDYYELTRILGKIDFTNSAHYEPGMDYRFIQAYQESQSLEEAFIKASNKKQSITRYRKLFLTSLLSIGKAADKDLISYIRPLAFNDTGRELLKNAKGSIIQKLRLREIKVQEEEVLQIDLIAQKLYEWLSGAKISRDYHPTFYYPNEKDG